MQANPFGRSRVIFYEGNNGTQDIVAEFDYSYKGRLWPNDEARSVELINLPKGSYVVVYDQPSSNPSLTKLTDDATVIRVVGDNSGYSRFSTFEMNLENDLFRMVYFRKNGLDGKVSSVEIKIADNDEL